MENMTPAAADPTKPLSSGKRWKQRHVENFGLYVALSLYFLAWFVVHLVNPTAGGFDLGLVQAFALPPLLFFLDLHVAIWCYKHFLPRLFAYLLSCIEEKMLTRVLPPHESLFGSGNNWVSQSDPAIIRLKISYAKTQFLIRCARFFLALSPLLFFLFVLLRLQFLALGLVPNSSESTPPSSESGRLLDEMTEFKLSPTSGLSDLERATPGVLPSWSGAAGELAWPSLPLVAPVRGSTPGTPSGASGEASPVPTPSLATWSDSSGAPLK